MNPATAMWLNLVLTAFGGAASALASSTGSSQVTVIAGAAVSIIGALNAALHGFSTANPGPLTK